MNSMNLYSLHLLKRLRMSRITISLVFILFLVSGAVAGADWYYMILPSICLLMEGMSIHKINAEITLLKTLIKAEELLEQLKKKAA